MPYSKREQDGLPDVLVRRVFDDLCLARVCLGVMELRALTVAAHLGRAPPYGPRRLHERRSQHLHVRGERVRQQRVSCVSYVSESPGMFVEEAFWRAFETTEMMATDE